MINTKFHNYIYTCVGLVFLLLFFASCGTYKEAYISTNELKEIKKLPKDVEKSETLFLLGDAGDGTSKDQKALFKHVRAEIEAIEDKPSVVFLGDNIYPAGLPKKSDPKRKEAEEIIIPQLEMVSNLNCETYFIPGNHDWNKMRKGGLKAVKRQEDFIQDYFEKNKAHFYPNNGCGDPVVKKAAKDLYYIFIDTQWWLQNWDEEKKINKGCEVKSRQEFLTQMQEAFTKHKNDQIVVFMHHPFYSNGEHGGSFSAKSHFFPLTQLNKKLWIPLPIIGSLVPALRSMGVTNQDIPNPEYQALKKGIEGLMRNNRNVIFASGHDHTLQYHFQGNHHHILSGSASKSNFAQAGGNASMVRSAKGYSVIHFYKNGEVWTDFVEVSEEKPQGNLFFRKQLVKPRAGTVPTENKYPPANTYEPTVTAAVNKTFGAGKFRQFFWGKEYRDLWTQKIRVPIIDIDNELGGLTPLKKGGSFSSNTLRLANEKGEHYLLRSITKDYGKIIGAGFSNLKFMTIASDINSGANPFGALLVPPLSRAANIYYTQPKLVYLKRQQALGYYNDLFPEDIYILEDRPSGDRSTYDNFGNSSEIIGYLDLIQEMYEDNSIVIDQDWTLRSRIFDMLIHDWDRHDDQWRWGKYENENGEEVYRPIPRDRDQVFYKFNGLLPFLASNTVIPRMKTFRDEIKSVKYQNLHATYFDRFFLNQMEWKNWKTESEYLMANITDEVIVDAANHYPKEVKEIERTEFIQKMKSRRDKLLDSSKKLYDYLAKEVDVVGSNEKEKFIIERYSNGNVKVEVFRLSKKNNVKDKIYGRTFKKNETNEIRLFGLAGKDQFAFSGSNNGSIKVRVIGGFGKDSITDSSSGGGILKKTLVYDETDGMEVSENAKVKDLRGPQLDENAYSRRSHHYDRTLVLPSFSYNIDDRWIFGLTATTTEHGFRKVPFKAKHNYGFGYSPTDRGDFYLHYNGDFKRVLFNWLDINPKVNVEIPRYINYFGLGNNTIKTTDERSFNWVRLNRINAELNFQRSGNNSDFKIYAGPKFTSWNVQLTEGRVVEDPTFNVTEDQIARRNFIGANAGIDYNNKDQNNYPKQGLFFAAKTDLLSNIENEERLSTFETEGGFYVTFGRNHFLTLASRTGFTSVSGNPQFYHYPSLGNNNYLRGYRFDRFRGEQIFYQNIDLRWRLGTWKNLYLPMDIGLLGGFDAGKIWFEDEENDNFKQSYTAGIWFNLLQLMVINPHMSFSEEEDQFNFRIGFNF